MAHMAGRRSGILLPRELDYDDWKGLALFLD